MLSIKGGNAWAKRASELLEADRAGAYPIPLYRYPLPGDWPVSLFVKDETHYPSGSVKHPFARELLRDAIAADQIAEHTPLVEATSGNMAVAEAYFARLLGLPFTAVVPHGTSAEKRARIAEHGGYLHAVDPPLAVYEQARRLANDLHGHYLDHLGTLAATIDSQTRDRACGPTAEIFHDLADYPPPTWIVVGVGTGASSRSIGRYLRQHGYPTGVAVVDPEHSAYFPGWVTDCADYATGMPSRIEGIGRPRMEPPFDPSVVDLVIPVPDAASVAAMRHFAATATPRPGPSTGAAFWGACCLLHRMMERGNQGSVVMVVADSAVPYTATYYDDGWIAAKDWDLTTPAAALTHFLKTGEWLGS